MGKKFNANNIDKTKNDDKKEKVWYKVGGVLQDRYPNLIEKLREERKEKGMRSRRHDVKSFLFSKLKSYYKYTNKKDLKEEPLTEQELEKIIKIDYKNLPAARAKMGPKKSADKVKKFMKKKWFEDPEHIKTLYPSLIEELYNKAYEKKNVDQHIKMERLYRIRTKICTKLKTYFSINKKIATNKPLEENDVRTIVETKFENKVSQQYRSENSKALASVLKKRKIVIEDKASFSNLATKLQRFKTKSGISKIEKKKFDQLIDDWRTKKNKSSLISAVTERFPIDRHVAWIYINKHRKNIKNFDKLVKTPKGRDKILKRIGEIRMKNNALCKENRQGIEEVIERVEKERGISKSKAQVFVRKHKMENFNQLAQTPEGRDEILKQYKEIRKRQNNNKLANKTEEEIKIDSNIGQDYIDHKRNKIKNLDQSIEDKNTRKQNLDKQGKIKSRNKVYILEQTPISKKEGKKLLIDGMTKRFGFSSKEAENYIDKYKNNIVDFDRLITTLEGAQSIRQQLIEIKEELREKRSKSVNKNTSVILNKKDIKSNKEDTRKQSMIADIKYLLQNNQMDKEVDTDEDNTDDMLEDEIKAYDAKAKLSRGQRSRQKEPPFDWHRSFITSCLKLILGIETHYALALTYAYAKNKYGIIVLEKLPKDLDEQEKIVREIVKIYDTASKKGSEKLAKEDKNKRKIMNIEEYKKMERMDNIIKEFKKAFKNKTKEEIASVDYKSVKIGPISLSQKETKNIKTEGQDAISKSAVKDKAIDDDKKKQTSKGFLKSKRERKGQLSLLQDGLKKVLNIKDDKTARNIIRNHIRNTYGKGNISQMPMSLDDQKKILSDMIKIYDTRYQGRGIPLEERTTANMTINELKNEIEINYNSYKDSKQKSSRRESGRK